MPINPKKTRMREQDPKVRAKNFDEVAFGYSREEAVQEAKRCLRCKKPKCISGCPVCIDIPGFVSLVAEEDFDEAVAVLKAENSLPAVCGRVCPQEVQCESKCVLGVRGEPVAIGRIERYLADYEREVGIKIDETKRSQPTGKRVAIVGSGPAGLTCAGDLVKLGHEVTIFEALHKTGGVLVYGIPEFRLPKAIVQAEVDYIKKLGAKIETDMVIGRCKTLDELFEDGYDAIYLGLGAGLPSFMNIPGENLNGVYSANEFLTRTNLMKAYRFPEYDTPIKIKEKVAVIGAGNVSMDSARCALRLGAREVHIVYRRSDAEMPARLEEIHHAKEEGIIFDLLTAPTEILGDEKGWVNAMKCVKMELGEPDASGRRRPVPIKGSEYTMPVDLVIVSIGTGANPLLTSTVPDMQVNKWGYILADDDGRTTKEGVWAGGDIVTGSATVIQAMGSGKRSAADINGWLTGGGEWKRTE